MTASRTGMTEQWQRHRPPPTTHDEFRALLDAGALITTGGKPLLRTRCPSCGSGLLGSVDGAETCWCAIECPQCHAPAGRRCRRPSEHDVFGNRAHDSRIRLAQDDTERRALAGDPDLPARWLPEADGQHTLW